MREGNFISILAQLQNESVIRNATVLKQPFAFTVVDAFKYLYRNEDTGNLLVYESEVEKYCIISHERTCSNYRNEFIRRHADRVILCLPASDRECRPSCLANIDHEKVFCVHKNSVSFLYGTFLILEIFTARLHVFNQASRKTHTHVPSIPIYFAWCCHSISEQFLCFTFSRDYNVRTYPS